MVANFEKIKNSPSFILNFRKSTKFQKVSYKALRVMDEDL